MSGVVGLAAAGYVLLQQHSSVQKAKDKVDTAVHSLSKEVAPTFQYEPVFQKDENKEERVKELEEKAKKEAGLQRVRGK